MTRTSNELDRLNRWATWMVAGVLVLFAMLMLPPGTKPAGYWDVLRDVVAPLAAVAAVVFAGLSLRHLSEQLRVMRADQAEDRRARLSADWAVLHDRTDILNDIQAGLAAGTDISGAVAQLDDNDRAYRCRTAQRAPFVHALLSFRRARAAGDTARQTEAVTGMLAATKAERAHLDRVLAALDSELLVEDAAPRPAADRPAAKARTGAKPWWVLSAEQMALIQGHRATA